VHEDRYDILVAKGGDVSIEEEEKELRITLTD